VPYSVLVSDDLVIGPDGAITVTGEGLRARLSKGRGRYRLRGGTTGFLIFERIGRSYESGGRVLMSGEIVGTGTMLEIVDAISHNGWRGELVVSSGDDTRGLVFDRGALRGVRTNVRQERLGEVMIARGVLSQDQRRACLRDHGSKRRFGETAVDKGYIDREGLFDMLRAQAEQVFKTAMLLDAGDYVFVVLSEDAEAPSMTVHLPLQTLLLETVRRMDELSALREHVPSSEVYPRAVPGATRMSMQHALVPVATLCDGQHNVLDIARELRTDELSATKAVAQLVQLGAVEIGDRTSISREKIEPIVRQLNEVLREITDTVERNGGGKAMRSTLRAWVRDTPLHEHFGDSVSIEGNVSVDAVMQQLDKHARPIEEFVHAAHELISFAMFAASPALQRPAERALSKWVNQRMARLEV